MMIEKNDQPLNIIAQIGETQVKLFNNPLSLSAKENDAIDNEEITNLIA
jgi:hypothetical protein